MLPPSSPKLLGGLPLPPLLPMHTGQQQESEKQSEKPISRSVSRGNDGPNGPLFISILFHNSVRVIVIWAIVRNSSLFISVLLHNSNFRSLSFEICTTNFRIRLVGWLVGLGFNGPLKTVFQSISDRLPEREKENRKIVETKKIVQTTPPALTASAIGSCPTIIQTSRTPRH